MTGAGAPPQGLQRLVAGECHRTSTSPAGTYYRAYLRDGILPTTASYTPTSGTLTRARWWTRDEVRHP